jgi:hypothetical protein
MRFREDKPEDRERARQIVREWRAANPQGTVEQMLLAVGPQFHKDYAPVLRIQLYLADRHTAKVTTGIVAAPRTGRP